DTGMGLERTNCILQGKTSVYLTEVFQPIIGKIETLAACALSGSVRDYIDNPSKPPFKFTSLLFVATARKNKFICSSLALIATLIREALLGAKNKIRNERSQVASNP
ncbi:MAG: hypothetical protein II283_04425, partial [Alistipes sp.]|nr:hypothetical protein [Alistipes sp.]